MENQGATSRELPLSVNEGRNLYLVSMTSVVFLMEISLDFQGNLNFFTSELDPVSETK